MNNSIPRNLKNVLKNKIKILLDPILYNTVDFIVDNLIQPNNNDNSYFSLMTNIQSSVRQLVKSAVISTFTELDNSFKNSPDRVLRYYVNKSDVPRTLVTVVGDISFSRTYYKNKFSGKKFFYIDTAFDLPKYDHYDPIVKGIAINNAINTSQAQSARDVTSMVENLTYFMDKSSVHNIPRQSVYNWIKAWNTPDIIPQSVETPETLYVMADEKFIGAQDIDKDIMVKCFVTFEGIKEVSKGRRELVNRSVFSCYSSNAWPLFMDFIAKRYDFSKIKNIALLSDGGTWIKTGISELRLDPNNKVKFYLCEFHFKQAIHHIISDENERQNLLNTFNNKAKQEFIDAVNNIIASNQNRKETITKKLNYIINNYSNIKSMLKLEIGSSMESHISHLIASFFASRPKGYSTKRIRQYLKLSDYKNNNINIFKLYMQSYKNKEVVKISEEIANNYSLDNYGNGNIPILDNGHVSPIYEQLNVLAH